MIWDSFMLGEELDMLECRLTELEEVPDVRHVIVEAGITHRGEPKPFHYAENRKRFDVWADRITYVPVEADELPSVQEDPDPWSREYAQREFARRGLTEAAPGDILLHGDCDEIPRPGALDRVRENPALLPLAFQMRLCQYAADWLHPFPWHGTIATRVRNVGSFAGLRGMRNMLPVLPDAGTHLSWMGGREAHARKLDLHCHLEMTEATKDALRSGEWLREGWHSDGHKLNPVDADSTWPRWVYTQRCPETWFRPRGEE